MWNYSNSSEEEHSRKAEWSSNFWFILYEMEIHDVFIQDSNQDCVENWNFQYGEEVSG